MRASACFDSRDVSDTNNSLFPSDRCSYLLIEGGERTARGRRAFFCNRQYVDVRSGERLYTRLDDQW